MKNISDEFDDIIDAIKKFFKIDSDLFDVDFFFIPESINSLNLKPQDNKTKGFKISYHFETGMKTPEFKIEGNIDDERIRELLKNTDLSKYPIFENRFKTKSIDTINTDQLSLGFTEEKSNLLLLEPLTEINNCKDYTEIIFDIPGMTEKDVMININEKGTELILNAENNVRRYKKTVDLPFKTDIDHYDMEVKNGLAIITVKKSDK